MQILTKEKSNNIKEFFEFVDVKINEDANCLDFVVSALNIDDTIEVYNIGSVVDKGMYLNFMAVSKNGKIKEYKTVNSFLKFLSDEYNVLVLNLNIHSILKELKRKNN